MHTKPKKVSTVDLDKLQSAFQVLSAQEEWNNKVTWRRLKLSEYLGVTEKALTSEECQKIWHPKRNGEFETDEYYTPNTPDQPCIGLVLSVLGEIDLDPCSPVGNPVIPAKWHYTINSDSLGFEYWYGKVFLNPPYSNPFPFVEKLCLSYSKGHIPEAIALLKAGTQANKGTGSLILEHASAICQWGAGKASRIAFIDKNGVQQKGADFDCIFVYFGPNWRLFDYHFRQYGHVMPTQRTVDKLLLA